MGTPSQALAADLRLFTSRAIYGDLARRVFSETWQVQNDKDGRDRKDIFKKRLLVSPEGRSVELRAVNKLPVTMVCDFNFITSNRDYFTRSSFQQVHTLLKPGEDRIIGFTLKEETAESVLVWPRLQIVDSGLTPLHSDNKHAAQENNVPEVKQQGIQLIAGSVWVGSRTIKKSGKSTTLTLRVKEVNADGFSGEIEFMDGRVYAVTGQHDGPSIRLVTGKVDKLSHSYIGEISDGRILLKYSGTGNQGNEISGEAELIRKK
jgi:hypothetical protein